MPASTSSAVPDFVSPPFDITLENVAGDNTDNVRVAPPRSAAPENVSVPVFVESPIVALVVKLMALARVRAAVESDDRLPPLNVSVPVPRAVLLPTRTVPADRVTPPLKVLAAESVRVPAPVFCSATVPLITADRTESAELA